ncbi:hypothetical protein EDD15DRAFT_2347521 [Pisolithus albus]|nr:hypothetical protein EDD15DRAFT_2347521 [Pisolithus albus]
MRKVDSRSSSSSPVECTPPLLKVENIDTERPLDLCTEIVFQDLLAIHMVRSRAYNVIIAFHPRSNLKTSSGEELQSIMQRTSNHTLSGRFTGPRDLTYYILVILWYVCHTWSEACEALYHFVEELERGTSETPTIRSLRKYHEVQVHLLYYDQLLLEFLMSIDFMRRTPHPAMETEGYSIAFMEHEVDKLLRDWGRLDHQTTMITNRLRSVMQLEFATVNWKNGRNMKRLVEASLRDATARKQITEFSTFGAASLIIYLDPLPCNGLPACRFYGSMYASPV